MRGTPLSGSVLTHYPLRRRTTAHRTSGSRAAGLVALAALALAGPAAAGTTATAPVYDEQGRLVQTPFAPTAGAARLTERQAIAVFRGHRKVSDWLDRYPPEPQTDAEYRPATGELSLIHI